MVSALWTPLLSVYPNFCFFWRFWGFSSLWCVVLYVFDCVDGDDNVDDNVGV